MKAAKTQQEEAEETVQEVRVAQVAQLKLGVNEKRCGCGRDGRVGVAVAVEPGGLTAAGGRLPAVVTGDAEPG
jgi:hypothetical protein